MVGEVEELINIIGLGYIGLPTALMFASHGVKVMGTDKNQGLIAMLNEGCTTFKEDGLNNLFSKAVQSGIVFSTDYQTSDVYIVSVPTPYDRDSKKIDSRYILSAIESIIGVCMKGAKVVIESTVSPGTIDRCVRPAIEKHGLIIGEDIHLAHAPERIIPGNMLEELVKNDRTIGADDPEIGEEIKALYTTFCKGEIVVTDIRTAEMTKVVENTYRDVNIAFANELLKICQSDGMDVYEIIRIANKHPRVDILSPGPGVGGHCISVDPWFLVGDYPELARLIRNARETNESMPDFVLQRASAIMHENGIANLSEIGIYGLAYKEDVDDIRDSPTLQMLECMERHLASTECKVYDPWVKEIKIPNQVLSFEEFLKDLKMVIIMVSHSDLNDDLLSFKDIIILDTRNVCGTGDNVYKL